MSVRHGYSTMGGIEYDDGDCVEKTKKGESLTLTRIINGLWSCPSIDVNMNFYFESFGSEHSCHNKENYIENYAR